MRDPLETAAHAVSEGLEESSAVALPNDMPGWAPALTLHRELSGLKFPTKDALRAALRLFWHDRDFFGVPRYYVGDWTIVVPTAAVEPLRARGLDFTVQPVALPGETSAERMNELRAQQGPR